jgi:integrase/recombinase XerC
MASMQNKRGSWYCRVSITDKITRKRKFIWYPLRTENKTEAHKRKAKIEKVESDIRNGIEFTFPWMADGGRTKVKELTLEEAINDWIERRRNQPNVTEATIKINENSIEHLFRSVDKSTPLKAITTKMMDDFSDYLVAKGLSLNTVNIHLRSVRTFFRYVWKRGMIDKLPMIEQLKVKDTEPIYFSDDEFHMILNEVGVDSFYGKVFFFYRETGLRLREPFIATLDGNWLDIPNTSKGKKSRSIELNDFLVEIFKELRQWAATCGLVEGSRGRHLSKKLKKSLRKCGVDESKHFHSLRHTFAVRQVVKGTPMAMIQSMMGHRSISTTEIYAEFQLKKLKRHFPTLIDFFQEDTKDGKKMEVITKRVITDKDFKAVTDGKWLN